MLRPILGLTPKITEGSEGQKSKEIRKNLEKNNQMGD